MTLKLISLATDATSAMVGKILDFKGLDYEVVDAAEEGSAQQPPARPSARGSSAVSDAALQEDKRTLQNEPAKLADAQSYIVQQLPAIIFADGESVVGEPAIIARLEAEYPEPTVLPPSHAGLHQILARYFAGELGTAVLRTAMPELLEHYRAKGPRALARYVRWVEQRSGAGFCQSALEETESNRSMVRQLLAPLESELQGRAFLLDRIGLADFALYGQLRSFACDGTLKLPGDFPALREHFLRVDRITAHLPAD
jgi:glutathione S-transferase